MKKIAGGRGGRRALKRPWFWSKRVGPTKTREVREIVAKGAMRAVPKRRNRGNLRREEVEEGRVAGFVNRRRAVGGIGSFASWFSELRTKRKWKIMFAKVQLYRRNSEGQNNVLRTRGDNT